MLRDWDARRHHRADRAALVDLGSMTSRARLLPGHGAGNPGEPHCFTLSSSSCASALGASSTSRTLRAVLLPETLSAPSSTAAWPCHSTGRVREVPAEASSCRSTWKLPLLPAPRE